MEAVEAVEAVEAMEDTQKEDTDTIRRHLHNKKTQTQ